jgi:hypothetical protein
MKKLMLITLTAMCTFAFTSCTKDYTCTCTYETNGSKQQVVTTIPQTTKAKAEDDCATKQTIHHPIVGYTLITCKL